VVVTDTQHRAAGEASDKNSDLAKAHRQAFHATLRRWVAAGWPVRPPRTEDYVEGEQLLHALVKIRFGEYVQSLQAITIVRRVLAKFLEPVQARPWSTSVPTAEEIFSALDDEILDSAGAGPDTINDPWINAETDEEFLSRTFGAGVDRSSVFSAMRALRQTGNLLMYRVASLYLDLAHGQRSGPPAFSDMAVRLTSEIALRDVTESDVHTAVVKFCVCLGRWTR
jgi:hypothetical protein